MANSELSSTVSAYDLPKLDEQSDSLQDSNYLLLTLHYKNGTAKGSYNVTLNSIGKYFTPANKMSYGTVKLATYRDFFTSIDGAKITPSNTLSDHVVSLALADARYLQLIDASAGEDKFIEDSSGQANKVIRTGDSGYISKSFFNHGLTAELSGIGRMGDSPIIATKSINDSAVMKDLFRLLTDRENNAGDSIFMSVYSSTNPLVDQTLTSTSVVVSNLKDKYKAVLLSNADDLNKGIINSVTSNVSALGVEVFEWPIGYSLITPKINFDEAEGYVGDMDVTGSIVSGTNTINTGRGNILTGYSFQQYTGEGVLGTGIQNISSAQFSIITGIKNKEQESYCNFTTGRGNTFKRSAHSFLSGISTTTNNLLASLVLPQGSDLNNLISSIAIGSTYKVSAANSSILMLAGTAAEGGSLNVDVASAERSIIIGKNATYPNKVSGSVISNTASTGGRMGGVNTSVIFGSNLNFDSTINYSVITGSGFGELDNQATRGDDYYFSAGILLAGTGAKVGKCASSTITVNGGSFNFIHQSVVSAYYLEADTVVASHVVAHGQTSETPAKLSKSYGSVISLYGPSTTASNVTSTAAFLTSSSSLSSASHSFIHLNSSTATSVNRSLVVADSVDIKSINDSLIIAKKSSGVTDHTAEIEQVSQSIIVGDIYPTADTENYRIYDSILVGDQNQTDSLISSLVVGREQKIVNNNQIFLLGSLNEIENLDCSMVVGQNNKVNGDIGNTDHTKHTNSTATVSGLGNNIKLAPDAAKNEWGYYDIVTLGSSNTLKGHLNATYVFGRANSINSEQIYSDDVTIIGKGNSITAIDNTKYSGSSQWDSILCIGSYNNIQYYGDTQDSSCLAQVFGSHLIVQPDKTGITQYYGFYNESLTSSSAILNNFKCKYNYHKGEITALWGVGTSKSRFTGMALGRKGDCYGKMVAQLYVAGVVTQTGADYAEKFRTPTGMGPIEYRHFVTLLNDMARPAKPGDDVIGITSEFPGTLGNADLASSPDHCDVGLMGQLEVFDDGTCVPNEYCECAPGAIATAWKGAIQKWRVMKRVNENTILVLFK